MPSWYLEDAREIAATAKYTFYKPPPEILAKVAVGEHVKLIFAFQSDDPEAPGAERMWVIVESIDGEGSYTGRLDNEPRHIEDLELGDLVSFRDFHIIQTSHEDENNLVKRLLARCFVTNRVLRDGVRVGRLYRESPDEERDSGWRILAGDESEEYLDETDNVAYVSLGAVLNCDDSFLPCLGSPVGTAFKRDESGAFVPDEFPNDD